MPTYLLHGFRWPRPLVRIHIILQNLDDAAAEWLVAPQTTITLLRNFNELYPECMQHLNRLRFIEQYDPEDTSASAASQPFAYVADMVEEVKLSIGVDDVVSRGISNEQWDAMMELRDRLAPEERVSWYVVVCGDEERLPPTPPEGMLGGSGSNETPSPERGGGGGDRYSGEGRTKPQAPPEEEHRRLRRLFGSTRMGKRKNVSHARMPGLARSKSYGSLTQNAPEPVIGNKPLLPGATASPLQQPGCMTNGHDSVLSSNVRLSNMSNLSNRASSNSNTSDGIISNGDSVPPRSRTEQKARTREIHATTPMARMARPDALNSNVPPSRRYTLGFVPDLTSEHPLDFDLIPTRFNPEPEAKYRVSPRRHTNFPAFSTSPRAVSPELTRSSHSPASPLPNGTITSASPNRTGAMSPVSPIRTKSILRSSSPLRSEVNDLTSMANNISSTSAVHTPRAESPVRAAHVLRDGNALEQQQASQQNEKALRALQGETPRFTSLFQVKSSQKAKLRLSLVTQVPPRAPVPEEDEDIEEVISMNPAARSPIVSYRRSRSSVAWSAPPNGSPMQMHLSGLNLTSQEDNRPYFGQKVGHSDLVATGLENALDRL